MTAHTENGKTHTLTIVNKIPEISRMSLWLTGCLARYGLPRAIQYNFDLCANEAVTNIISYGFPSGGEHQIRLELLVTPAKARLLIQDDGVAFNPLEAPEHVQPDSLEQAKIGGLGIDLIRHYMDEYAYRRKADTNMLLMQIKLPKEA